MTIAALRLRRPIVQWQSTELRRGSVALICIALHKSDPEAESVMTPLASGARILSLRDQPDERRGMQPSHSSRDTILRLMPRGGECE